MRRYRDGSGTRWSRVAWAWMLVLPPAANVGLHWFGPRATDPAEATHPWVTMASLQDELSAIEEMRQRLPQDVRDRLPTLEDPTTRYLPVPADVLPLGDPSPLRGALWALPREDILVPPDSCAIAGGALLGRVQWGGWASSMVPIVRVQTLLDPDFRVRFRTEGAQGMLEGTGRRREGHPVLEFRYLSESAVLEPGAAVVTEGDDGVYPPGVAIGCVASAAEESDASGTLRPVVVAFLRPEEIRRLELRWSRRVEDAATFVRKYEDGER